MTAKLLDIDTCVNGLLAHLDPTWKRSSSSIIGPTIRTRLWTLVGLTVFLETILPLRTKLNTFTIHHKSARNGEVKENAIQTQSLCSSVVRETCKEEYDDANDVKIGSRVLVFWEGGFQVLLGYGIKDETRQVQAILS